MSLPNNQNEKEQVFITADDLEDAVGNSTSSSTFSSTSPSNEKNIQQNEYHLPTLEELKKEKTEQKNQKWIEFLRETAISKSFLVRSIIASIVYWSVSFSSFIVQNFWINLILAPIYLHSFLPDRFMELSNGSEEIYLEYVNMFLQNGLYLILFVVIVPLFWKEIVQSGKALMKKWWLLLSIPILHFILLIVSAVLQTIANIFITLPDTSVNQEMINQSLEVSVWGNVFPTVIAAPFVEEIIFRTIIAGLFFYLLYFIIKKTNMPAKRKYIFASIFGIIASAITFGLLHVVGSGKGDYLAMLPYVIMGASFAIIYFATKKNLLFVILIHMYNNAFSIFAFYLYSTIFFK